MSCCRETVEMAVIPGNRRKLDPRRTMNSTSQGELVLSVAEGTPEDARKDGQIHGRSRQLLKYPGASPDVSRTACCDSGCDCPVG